MDNTIESELKKFLLDNVIYVDGPFPVADDASLLGAGIIDSLGVQELVEFVSRRYGFEVPIQDITPENFDSITQVGSYVRRRLTSSTAARPPAPPALPLAAPPS